MVETEVKYSELANYVSELHRKCCSIAFSYIRRHGFGDIKGENALILIEFHEKVVSLYTLMNRTNLSKAKLKWAIKIC